MGREEDDWNVRYNEVWGDEMDENRPVRISDPSLLDSSYRKRAGKGYTHKSSSRLEKQLSGGNYNIRKRIFIAVVIFALVVLLGASIYTAGNNSQNQNSTIEDDDDFWNDGWEDGDDDSSWDDGDDTDDSWSDGEDGDTWDGEDSEDDDWT